MGVLRCLLLLLVCCLNPSAVTHAQDGQAGFISIDCGAPVGSYDDPRTGIHYISDEGFVETGESKTISTFNNGDLSQLRPYTNVRSFPEGVRNCYLIRLDQGNFKKYLIRAVFCYGNYDGQNNSPQFELHFGVDYWITISVSAGTDSCTSPEIIHVPLSDIVHVCLVNTGKGTPFISSLELRPLDDTIYSSSPGSLKAVARQDHGNNASANAQNLIRYGDDVFDRIWLPFGLRGHTTLVGTSMTNFQNDNSFKIPPIVMRTATIPIDNSKDLTFQMTTKNLADQYYFYFHFSEIQLLQANESRQFYIYLNDRKFIDQLITPSYTSPLTVFSTRPETSNDVYEVSLRKSENSTLPPILNAFEAYMVIDLHSQTDDKDTDAMLSIKLIYGLTRNWQGDPCAPEFYLWDGINCSFSGSNPPRITYLNLSSSGITGSILGVIANLSNLETLDLSNNKLTGQIPNFLGNLLSLKVLNIKGNNFSGPIPSQLLSKWRDGALILSGDGLPNNEVVKKTRKGNPVVTIAASISGLFAVSLIILAVFWRVRIKRRECQKKVTESREESNNTESQKELTESLKESNDNVYSLKEKKTKYSYSDILSITNNLQTPIGSGSFDKVYRGTLNDNDVAVKMFYSTSLDKVFKELLSEFNVLSNVRHKNLIVLKGYCIDGKNMGIIYEFMANGDLNSKLSERNSYVLSWHDRIQIALDAAKGLEYLHHGIEKAIVHRDVKCTNILLDEKLRAKIADFGLSRAYPVETASHVSTDYIAFTPGYLDPEYRSTGRLTEKSDVYSFGVVILEIITGKPAIIATNINPPTHLKDLVGMIIQQGDMNAWVDSRLMGELVDSRLMRKFEVSAAKKAVEVAMACVSQESADRPTMTQVVMVLKECLEMARA